ncbi:MAG: immunoglobulin domain-containing protein [Phycisphaerales bacterium]
MKRVLSLAGLAVLLPWGLRAQTGYSITGGLGNFDCGNHTDDGCDEFEIEIEDLSPGDVVHTYHNGNYGSPTVTQAPNGTSTIIDYRNPQHLTAVNAVEHFGVSLRQLSPTNVIRVRWMRGGQTATVNGQVPQPGGGTAPATQPTLPQITSEMGAGSGGGDGVTCTVTNTDMSQSIWVRRRAQVTQGSVTLEALMPNDPVVTSAVELDAAPFLLGPGQSVSVTSDLIEIEENQSVVFAAQYYQDLFVGGPFNQSHARGPELGNVMTASLAATQGPCEWYAPVILAQPADVVRDLGRSFDIWVDADANDMDLSYQWFKDGQALVAGGLYGGVTSDSLSVDEMTAETEGFYYVRVSNACGTAESRSALAFITGHNVPPPRPEVCDSIDFNNDQLYPDTTDIDDFLSVFSGGGCSNDPACGDIDFNNDGLFPDTMDIDALLSVFSGGSCVR